MVQLYARQVRVCNVKYAIALIVAIDILGKNQFRSSARGASFHTKLVSNANVVRVVLLDANSYLALWAKKENWKPKGHHQPINFPSAGVQAFLMDYPHEKRALTFYEGPVRISG
jgi:hypothetical protein